MPVDLRAMVAPEKTAIVLQEVLRRLPDLHVDEAGVRPYPTTPLISGFQAMPATFTPGATEHPLSEADAPPARAERLKHAAAALAETADGAEDDPWQPVANATGSREG